MGGGTPAPLGTPALKEAKRDEALEHERERAEGQGDGVLIDVRRDDAEPRRCMRRASTSSSASVTHSVASPW